ncbi:PREDICTED: uncharacterized protein LOC107072504 [Polistes dominula]|uniref:Uncharacterized protein LOC107072504 n=1 Tax=Polistes dominula TaxID=743375 RepID=A0ABM1J694_POLDO|nr:PREDICTED: uncharacterized protein LOC107072504 [Polistes dominula]
MDYQHYVKCNKQLQTSERACDKRISMELTEEEEEYEEDDDDEEEEEEEEDKEKKKKMVLSNHHASPEIKTETRLGLCSVCHLSLTGKTTDETNVALERTSISFQGHLLCRRCIEHYSFQSGQRHVNVRYLNFFELTITICVSTEGHKIMDSTNYPNNYNVEQNDGKYYHQQQSYFNLLRKDDRDQSIDSELKFNVQTTWECSRRPIRCPRVDCSVNVAFSALTHHFLFDHPEVPILCVDPGLKSTLIVAFSALSYNTSRCLALLLVSGKLSDSAARLFNSNQINPKYRNRLPLPLLAARLPSTNSFSNEVYASGEGQCERNTIIVWIAGLDIGNAADILRYTIQVVDNIDNESFRSLTFTGPINSLRTAQHPQEVFFKGDCIVLHEGLIGHITSGCTNLNLNVIIH